MSLRRVPLALALLAAALAGLAPRAAGAQTRDTLRLGGPRPEREDSIRPYDPDEDRAAAARDTARRASSRDPMRWSEPFRVEGNGRATPRRQQREVVVVHPDSVRREGEEAEGDSIRMAEESDRDTVTLDLSESERTDARRSSSNRRSSSSRAAEEEESTDRSSSSRRSASAEEEEEAPERSASSSRSGGSSRTGSSRRASSAEEEESSDRSSTSRRSSEEEEAPARRGSTRRAADEEEPSERSASPRRSGDGESSSSANRRSNTTSGSRARTHTVVAGETLFGIARKYGVTAAQIRALNQEVDWESSLDIGTVLRLPAAARASGQASADRPSSTRSSASSETRRETGSQTRSTSGRRTHTVAAGETLYGLARRYGVTVAQIRAANGLDEDASLRIGQTLAIPRAQPQNR